MRTKLLGLVVVLCALIIGVGQAAASSATFPDGSASQAIFVGPGELAFAFLNDLIPPDIFIHAVNPSGDLVPVNLSGFVGSVIWLSFEDFTSTPGLLQFGVYTCNSASLVFCSVPNIRRGTLLLFL